MPTLRAKQKAFSSVLDRYASMLVYLLFLMMLVMLRMDAAMMNYDARVLMSLQQILELRRAESWEHTMAGTSNATATKLLGKMTNEHKISACDALMGTKMEDYFYICEPRHHDNYSTTMARAISSAHQHLQSQYLKCRWNPLLKSSFCEAHNLILDPTKIIIEANGGEDITQVQGRDESDEFPTYQPGALRFDAQECSISSINATKLKPPKGTLLPHHLRTIMDNIITSQQQYSDEYFTTNQYRNNQQKQIDIVVERPTLFVTRYEYANLYHTYTDWYSAYQAVMVALDGDQAAFDTVDIIILDGHAKGSLDDGWKLLFPQASISFVSELRRRTTADGTPHKFYFRHAIFVPPGYRAPISMNALEDLTLNSPPCAYVNSCTKTKWQADFRSRMVRHALERIKAIEGVVLPKPFLRTVQSSAEHRQPSQVVISGSSESDARLAIKVLLVSRRDYISHPRMNGQVTRKISNELELLKVMEQLNRVDISGRQHRLRIETASIVLEKHDVAEQIVAFQEADVVVGMHGAGLSHIFLARPGTMLLEMKSPGFIIQKHFEYLGGLAGCLYQVHIPNLAPLANRYMPYSIPIHGFQASFYQTIQSYLTYHGS